VCAAGQTRLEGHRNDPAKPTRQAQGLYIIGENPLVSDADLNHAQKSFE
jgi:hypothetical protein